MLEKLRGRIHPAFIVWITIMWCLLMGHVTWGAIIGGFIVGLIVVIALTLPAMPLGNVHVHWGLLLRFLARWCVDLFRASCKVAWLALRPADPPKTAIIECPVRVANELVLYLAVVFYNLQPGGSITDIDIANRMVTIHLLDVDTPADLQREVDNVARLESQLIRIFEEV